MTFNLRETWGRLQGVPLGRRLFSAILWRIIPYTGSVRPHILELRPGYARVEMRDRRAVRNHLQCIHAIALMNLGELVTGLAVTMALPEGAKAIVTDLSMKYLKKARGTLVGTCEARLPGFEGQKGDVDCVVEGEIRDAKGEIVAVSKAQWRIRL